MQYNTEGKVGVYFNEVWSMMIYISSLSSTFGAR